MSRLMSVSLTEDAVVARRKTVTRRLGWWTAKPGDRITLCRKVMGRKRRDGTVEPLVRLAEVEVVSVRREELQSITDADLVREGFAGWDALDWIHWFCEEMRCTPQTVVTRIEWRYLDSPQSGGEVGAPADGKGSAPTHNTKPDRPFVSFDPAMRVGQPCINHTRIPIWSIAGMVWAGEPVEAVAEDYDISRWAVLVACWYQGTYGGRSWRKRWKEWADVAHEDLWHSRPDMVSNPPRRPE